MQAELGLTGLLRECPQMRARKERAEECRDARVARYMEQPINDRMVKDSGGPSGSGQGGGKPVAAGTQDDPMEGDPEACSSIDPPNARGIMQAGASAGGGPLSSGRSLAGGIQVRAGVRRGIDALPQDGQQNEGRAERIRNDGDRHAGTRPRGVRFRRTTKCENHTHAH